MVRWFYPGGLRASRNDVCLAGPGSHCIEYGAGCARDAPLHRERRTWQNATLAAGAGGVASKISLLPQFVRSLAAFGRRRTGGSGSYATLMVLMTLTRLTRPSLKTYTIASKRIFVFLPASRRVWQRVVLAPVALATDSPAIYRPAYGYTPRWRPRRVGRWLARPSQSSHSRLHGW